MMDKDESADRDELLKEFIDFMAAQRVFLSLGERRAATEMLAAGFDFFEAGAFFRKSEWGSFHRKCLLDRLLPEAPCILAALRMGFDSGMTVEAASELAIEALRRHIEELEDPLSESEEEPASGSPCAETIALEIQMFGRDALRRRNWPDWMGRLVQSPGRPAAGPAA